MLLLIALNVASGFVNVDHGVITLDEDNCTVLVNSISQPVIGRTVAGYHFGIIKYDCPSYSGIKVSKMKCSSCGIFCAYNQMIEGCESKMIPLISGVVVGVIMTLLVLLCIKSRAVRAIHSLVDWFYYIKQLRGDVKVEKETDKISKVMNAAVPYKYSNTVTLSHPRRIKIEQRRMDMQYKKAMCIGLMTLAATAPRVEACDKTLFVSSTGMICEKNTCDDNTMISLSLQIGNHICLKSNDDSTTEIRITESSYRIRYTYEYDTMSYGLEINDHWQCKLLNSECWNGKCHPDERHSTFKSDNSTLIKHGCLVGTLGCDTWCFAQTSCTWYEARVVPSKKVHKVYKFQSKIWEVSVDVTRRGFTVRQVLNSNNALLNVDDIGIKNKSIPMVINSVLSEEYRTPSYLMVSEGFAYEIDACDKNYPTLGRFGDIQMNTKGEVIFPVDDIDFSVRSCKVYAKVREPQMDRFYNSIENYNPISFRSIDLNRIIEIKQHTMATYNFMLQLDNFKSLTYNPSNCQYEVISTFACDSCDQKPHAVLQPVVVTHMGLIQIISNCSIASQLIPCGPEPVMIVFNDLPQTCEIQFPKLNRTLTINFEYIFKGSLKAIESRMYSNAKEDFSALVNNFDFLTGVVSSITTIAGVSVIATFCLRLFRLYQINKADNALDKV